MPDGGGSSENRIDARERALELLYEADIKGLGVRAVVDSLPLEPDPFTVRLVFGVADHLDEIDEELSRVSRGWDLDRMPLIDRAVLRLGFFELRWTPEVPTAVVLNEAVELAKTFSTEKSSKFVNGVLARLAADHRRSDTEGPEVVA